MLSSQPLDPGGSFWWGGVLFCPLKDLEAQSLRFHRRCKRLWSPDTTSFDRRLLRIDHKRRQMQAKQKHEQKWAPQKTRHPKLTNCHCYGRKGGAALASQGPPLRTVVSLRCLEETSPPPEERESSSMLDCLRPSETSQAPFSTYTNSLTS